MVVGEYQAHRGGGLFDVLLIVVSFMDPSGTCCEHAAQNILHQAHRGAETAVSGIFDELGSLSIDASGVACAEMDLDLEALSITCRDQGV